MEQVDGMFASIVIILPCDFTGGDIRLSYGGLAPGLDCVPKSVLSTTVVSWYRGVTREMAPVTSGYRLALSYNLIHTAQDTMRPAPHDTTELANRLRRILLSWTDAPDEHPMLVILLLNGTYPSEGIRDGGLRGKDAQKAALLQRLAQQHGVCIGLVDLECREIGYAEDREPLEREPRARRERSYDYLSRRKYGYYDDYDEDEDDDEDDDGEDKYDEEFDPHDLDLREGEDVEVSWGVQTLVGLQGSTIADELPQKLFDSEDAVTIPSDLLNTMMQGSPDEVEYEGYDGPVRAPLDVLDYSVANCGRSVADRRKAGER